MIALARLVLKIMVVAVFSASVASANTSPPICGLTLARNPFVALVVKAHSDQILTLADVQKIARSAGPLDPLADIDDTVESTSIKTAFRILMGQSRTQNQWPQTVAELTTWLETLGHETKARDQAKKDTQRFLSPHLLTQINTKLRMDVTTTDDGQVLLAHVTVGAKLRVHDLGNLNAPALFEFQLPDKESASLPAWHRDANGKLRLYFASTRTLTDMAGTRQVVVRSWDWASLQEGEIIRFPVVKESGNAKRWISVPGHGLLLEIPWKPHTMFTDVTASDVRTQVGQVLASDKNPVIVNRDLYLPNEDGQFKHRQSIPPLEKELHQIIGESSGVLGITETSGGKLALMNNANEKPAFWLQNGDTFEKKPMTLPFGFVLPPSFYETHDKRLLVAGFIFDPTKGYQLVFFEPLVSKDPIYTLPAPECILHMRLQWFTENQQPLLGVLPKAGSKGLIIRPLEKSALEFTAPDQTEWLQSGNNIYYYKQTEFNADLHAVFGEQKP